MMKSVFLRHGTSASRLYCRLLFILIFLPAVSFPPNNRISIANAATSIVTSPTIARAAVSTTIALPTIIATISTGGTSPQPMGLDVNPVTNRIYTTTAFPANLVTIDGATNTLAPSVPVSQNLANNLAVNPKTNRIFVVNSIIDNTLLMFNGSTNAYISSVFIEAV